MADRKKACPSQPLMLHGSDFLPLPAPGETPPVTRFAPSPSGYLHLGHAYAALIAWESARAGGGRFLLRIEDIDPGRCRPEFEHGIIEDLLWLGLGWDEPPLRQSEHLAVYAEALRALEVMGLIYPCFCTRRKIRAEVAHAAQAPHGPAGEAVYPGICRALTEVERSARTAAGEPYALRLDVARAVELVGPLSWTDLRAGEIEARPLAFGDVVLARKDAPTSYHLSVTVDDARQGVGLVTRGEDLFHATHIHRLLQALLGLPVPRYYHHNLIADSTGVRLAKRNRAITLRTLRQSGRRPDDVWRMIGLPDAAPLAAVG